MDFKNIDFSKAEEAKKDDEYKEDKSIINEEVKKVKKGMDEIKKESSPELAKEITDTEHVLGQVLEAGVDVIKEYLQSNKEVKKYDIDKRNETEQKRFETINVIDKRKNVFSLIILSICITALVILSVLDKLNSSVATLLAVVITSIFKDNITNLFKDIGNSLTKKDN